VFSEPELNTSFLSSLKAPHRQPSTHTSILKLHWKREVQRSSDTVKVSEPEGLMVAVAARILQDKLRRPGQRWKH